MNPIPAEEPVLLLDTVKAYLAGQGGDPRARQQAQETRRREAEQAIAGHLDPLRRKWFWKLLASAQACAVERENAIADIGLPYPPLRRLLRELGQRLAAGGAITRPSGLCHSRMHSRGSRWQATMKKFHINSPTWAYCQSLVAARAAISRSCICRRSASDS
jgi:hypothetical protein